MSGWIERPARRACWLLILWLAGCAPAGPDAVLADYLERVARVTGSQVREAEPAPLRPYPARRDLRVAVPEISIDVGEFFDLHGCDMGDLAGFRNSPLGRVQTASQRLGYETAWLAAAARCGADAPDWLADVARQKRGALPALFWNATFAAEELHAALGGAGHPTGDFADLLRRLNDAYGAALSGDLDLSAFEDTLGRLREGGWVGGARREWAGWRRTLSAASALLEGALPGICLNGQPTPDSRILANVFMKFYVERIQPEMAGRMRRQEAWIYAMHRLRGRLAAVSPPAFDAWYRDVLAPDRADSEWRRTRAAIVDHARAWQRLFRHCGIEPLPGLGQD